MKNNSEIFIDLKMKLVLRWIIFKSQEIGPIYSKAKKVNKTTTENIEDNRFDIGNFEYNEENDKFICLENQKLKFLYRVMRKKGRENTDFIRELNEKCEFSKNCTKRMEEIRHLKIGEFSKEKNN